MTKGQPFLSIIVLGICLDNNHLCWSVSTVNDPLLYCIMYTNYLFVVLCHTYSTLSVILGRVVGRAEKTSIYTSSWSRFSTVNCQRMTSNYQIFPLEVGPEFEIWPQR